MIKLLVTGATGTTGAEVIRQALLHPSISEVTALVRRPLPPHIASDNPKLKTIIHKDYSTFPPSLVEQVRDHDAVIWAQGVSSAGYKEADYDVITREYPLACAKALAGARGSADKKLTFCYVSGGAAFVELSRVPLTLSVFTGQGADQEKPVSAMFGRVKGRLPWPNRSQSVADPLPHPGRAEKELASISSSLPIAPYSFRPAGIAPIHPIPEAAFLNRAANYLFPIFRRLAPSFVINADVLARGLLEVALRGSSGEVEGWEGKGGVGNEGVFTSEEIKVLAKSSPVV